MDMMGSGIYFVIAPAPERWEILDWYHLKENLYKVGGSLKRLTQAEALLWQGKTDEAKALVNDCQRKQARNFEAYLDKHRTRIVNYAYHQAEQLCSMVPVQLSLRSSKLTAAYKFQGQMERGVRKPNVAIEMRVSQRSTLVLTVFA